MAGRKEDPETVSQRVRDESYAYYTSPKDGSTTSVARGTKMYRESLEQVNKTYDDMEKENNGRKFSAEERDSAAALHSDLTIKRKSRKR